VEKWLKETEEAWELARKNVDPFTFFVSDVDAVVDLLNKQGYVPVEDFLNFVKAADVLVQLRRKLSAETGVLGSLAKRIVPLDAWLNDVRSKVDESGFVKDDASRKLSDIRRDQKRLSNEIQDKLQREMDRYQRFISDRLVVKRGNRYAIPVKSSNVPQVKGIVLDWSGSGQTSNEAKMENLGVKPETLEKYGAVSSRTAMEMAEGVRKIASTDIGLAVTGIAGPDGGTDEKPVGLVYVALAHSLGTEVRELRLAGNRNRIRNLTVLNAFDMVRRYVMKLKG